MNRLLRKLPFIAALLAFALAFVWLDQEKQFRREQYPAFSLHNTSEQGCSLAFRYLKEMRSRDSGNELNRAIELSGIESDAVVFRIGPQVFPGEHADRNTAQTKKPGKKKSKTVEPAKPLMSPGEMKWVEGGGRLVLALQGKFGPLESLPLIASEPLRKVFPIWPNIDKIDAASSRMLSGAPLAEAHTLLAMGTDSYASRLKIGKGEVILFAAADIFSNRYLGDAGHLQLLTALASQDRAFYFDEYVHELQSTPGMFEMLDRWGFGMALIVVGAISLGAFWRARVPVGPPEDPYRETRSQAVDFVGSLAPLYERSLTQEQALAAHYKNFLQTAAAQSGLRGDALAAKIRSLLAELARGAAPAEARLAGREQLSRSEFERLLGVLNEAYRRLELAHRH